MARWGNALGGFRKQKRDKKGRFAGKSAKSKYRSEKRTIRKNKRRNIRGERLGVYRRNNRRGFQAVARSFGANPTGRTLTRDMKFSRNVMVKHYKAQAREQRASAKKRYRAAKSGVSSF